LGRPLPSEFSTASKTIFISFASILGEDSTAFTFSVLSPVTPSTLTGISLPDQGQNTSLSRRSESCLSSCRRYYETFRLKSRSSLLAHKKNTDFFLIFLASTSQQTKNIPETGAVKFSSWAYSGTQRHLLRGSKQSLRRF